MRKTETLACRHKDPPTLWWEKAVWLPKAALEGALSTFGKSQWGFEGWPGQCRALASRAVLPSGMGPRLRTGGAGLGSLMARGSEMVGQKIRAAVVARPHQIPAPLL